MFFLVWLSICEIFHFYRDFRRFRRFWGIDLSQEKQQKTSLKRKIRENKKESRYIKGEKEKNERKARREKAKPKKKRIRKKQKRKNEHIKKKEKNQYLNGEMIVKVTDVCTIRNRFVGRNFLKKHLEKIRKNRNCIAGRRFQVAVG